MSFCDVLFCRNRYVHKDETQRRKASVIFVSTLAVLLCCFGCSGGSSSKPAPPPSAAPANLVYPQANISVVAGQPIAASTPTVTGVVTSYSVSPALPAGLTLNTSTGAISGTPTVASPQTNYTITATNSSGSTTTTIQIAVTAAVTAPTNLAYPQTTIAVIVGQAITTETPTVSGTVTLYTISPSLPAGLNLDSTTGAISGTPTAVAAQAAYTVTASNSAGSTNATIQITVNAATPPPSGLAYPVTSIVATVGQPITTDIPNVTGMVTSYTVSPALPAGLSLEPKTGAILGTPTAVAAQAAYTVTAINAGGNTTAVLTITVSKALNALLDLGHSQSVQTLRVVANQVLSQDSRGHWLLSDDASGAELASGDSVWPSVNGSVISWPVDMAGTTIVIGITNGLEIRSSSDGHLLTTIASPTIDSVSQKTWWKLASDGSYVCAGSQAGLSAWSPTGQLLLSKSGDYSTAKAFAAPGEIRVALGPAGQNVIETVSVVDSTSITSPSFSGNFNTWFLDGANFLTNLSSTVWTYSKAGVQLGVTSLPTEEILGGQGNWFWTYEVASQSTLSIYSVGGSSPSATYSSFTAPTVVPSATTIGIFSANNTLTVFDLSSAVPSRTDYQLPVAGSAAYAALSGSQWWIGNEQGVIFDGSSLSGIPRYLTLGAATSISGSSSKAAVATASGKILYFQPTVATPEGSIEFSGAKIALSSDGTVLAAAASASNLLPDRTLKVFSLPGETLINSWPYSQSGTDLIDFTLSDSGTMIGQITGTYVTSTWNRQVGPLTGGTVWSDVPGTSDPGPIRLSPDGTLVAVSEHKNPSIDLTTKIYKNGILVTAVPGWVVGWIDNGRILVNEYINESPDSVHSAFAHASIFSATGTELSQPALPELLNIQDVTSDSIYSPDLNEIFSLSTGQSTWSSPYPSQKTGAVSGPYVVFEAGSRILVDTY